MEDIQRCSCCKTCKSCPEFQKVVDLQNAGLVIYRYSTGTEDVNTHTGHHENSKAVFIVHNTKNVDITSDSLISVIDDYKKCPRCKYILEQAQRLLHKVPTIDKLKVLGICDKCRSKERKGISCCKCNNVVKKFIALKMHKTKEQFQTTNKEQKLFNMQNLNNLVKKDDQYKIHQTRSESFLNNLCHGSSKEIHKPLVAQLFEPKKELHEINLKSQPGRIRFSLSLQKFETILKDHSDSELEPKIFLESKIKLKKPSAPFNKMMSLELSTKRIIDYPIRPISPSEDSVTFDIHEVRKRAAKLQSSRSSEQYNKNLHFPHCQKIYNEKKDADDFFQLKKESSIWKLESEHSFINKDKIKIKRLELERKVTAGIGRIISESRLNEETGIIKKKWEHIVKSSLIARKYNSEEALLSSIVPEKKESLHKDFSYFFIKETDQVKKPIQKRKSSSELIKDTQNMLLARKEELDKKKEEGLKRRQEEVEKKKISREENMKLIYDKKRILEEEKEKNALEVNKNVTHETHDKTDDGSKKISVKEKVRKDTRTPSVKIKKSTTQVEFKIDKNAQAEAKKTQKEKEKQEKEDKTKLEKERKLKEKEDKDKLRKEKEQQLKNAKEDKERIKKERKEKEELVRKAKQREEYSRKEKEQLKQEKEEQFRQEKEEKEKLKKEKDDKNKEKNIQKNEINVKQRTQGENKDQILKKDDENDKIKRLIDKKTKDYTEPKFKEKEIKDTPGQSKFAKIAELPQSKELNINQVKIRKPSTDDLILQLVKLKQSEEARPRERAVRLSEVKIPVEVITEHKKMHRGLKLPACVICNDSELELDIEDIMLNKNQSTKIDNVIIGSKIFKCKPIIIEKVEEQTVPLLFTSTFKDTVNIPETGKSTDNTLEQIERKVLPLTYGKNTEQEVPKGVIRYALSDRTFIDKGWTMLPTEKVVRKMNVYRMRPAHPEFDWFEHNKNKKMIYYDSGEKLAEFDDIGRGRLYYRSGRLALNYYDAEEINAQQRFVIHSSGEHDESGRSRPLAILATFDYLGNGIVFDHTGKIRLKYNQTEGVVLDRNIGPISHWKWHTLNDPPVLQQVMIDTQMAHKDPDILKFGGPADNKMRPDNEEMLAIEFDNFIKEKSKKLSQKFKPFQIKMKALKINEHFSLKVLDQATVYLIFRDGSTNLKLNIGMMLDHQEIVDTDTAEVGEVSNSLERFPARTDSLAGLQKSVAFAQRVERARMERERRLRPTQPRSSSDKLTAAASRPLRTTLRTVPSNTTMATGDCKCKCRKPPFSNLYYDTRLV